MQNKLWYAVQLGDDYAMDDGSYNYNEARALALSYAANIDDIEIRIVTCENGDNAIAEEIIREGEKY